MGGGLRCGLWAPEMCRLKMLNRSSDGSSLEFTSARPPVPLPHFLRGKHLSCREAIRTRWLDEASSWFAAVVSRG